MTTLAAGICLVLAFALERAAMRVPVAAGAGALGSVMLIGSLAIGLVGIFLAGVALGLALH